MQTTTKKLVFGDVIELGDGSRFRVLRIEASHNIVMRMLFGYREDGSADVIHVGERARFRLR